MTTRTPPDVLGRGWSSPAGCTCDGYYYDQHDDPGCPYHVEPRRRLSERLHSAWHVFVVGRWR